MPSSASKLKIIQRNRLACCFVVAVVLSFMNHAVSTLAVLTLGRAFGDAVLSLWEYAAVFSVATIVSAIPAAPGGWGLGEATYGYLFDLLGASAAIGVATSITFRLCQLCFSLLGGLFMLAPSRRVHLADVDELE